MTIFKVALKASVSGISYHNIIRTALESKEKHGYKYHIYKQYNDSTEWILVL